MPAGLSNPTPRLPEPAPRLPEPAPRLAEPAPRLPEPAPRLAEPAPRLPAPPHLPGPPQLRAAQPQLRAAQPQPRAAQPQPGAAQPSRPRPADVSLRRWIGGSPCAGKSSIAELLARRHGLTHFECDAGSAARESALPQYRMDVCERLAQPPRWQADREFAFYRDQFELLLPEFPPGRTLIEGADLLPEALYELGVTPAEAVWLVPTPDVQRRWYAARDWVRPYLSGCPDPAQAFENWMLRDIIFADRIRASAADLGYRVLVVDGSRTIEQTAGIIERHLSLRPRKLS
jgi:hypothetical protein